MTYSFFSYFSPSDNDEDDNEQDLSLTSYPSSNESYNEEKDPEFSPEDDLEHNDNDDEASYNDYETSL